MIDQQEKKNYLPGVLVFAGIFVFCVVAWSEAFRLLERALIGILQ